MTDREQIRRDAEPWLRAGPNDDTGRLARHVRDLLTELEQAERERDEARTEGISKKLYEMVVDERDEALEKAGGRDAPADSPATLQESPTAARKREDPASDEGGS